MSHQQLTRYMPTVVGYRERLATLQGAWDSLALLSHLNGDGTNLGNTRQAFESLAVDLVEHLAEETRKKAILAAKARAQVAIDILVRNLFERTADIGFLAADDAIRCYARDVPLLHTTSNSGGAEAQSAARTLAAATQSLQRRLAEYVAKYSVYNNVVLISPEGEILLQLEGGRAPAMTRDPLVAATLCGNQPYVETFRQSDLVPDARRALIYSQRVTADQQTVGVLCLCFRLADECDSIFAKLHTEGDWTVLALLDEKGEVIASSDNHQVPVGARVSGASSESGDIVRFAGREYLAITRTAHPYQGYAGPRWRGHVMLPLERAFEAHTESTQIHCSTQILSDLRASSTTFSTALREIPRKADAVQRDLNRSVWNGSVRLSSRDPSNGVFAKALLREISNMGRKTKEVFERSISELHETVVSSILHDSQFMASLAVELLARNLYERANDCRWWALDATLTGAVSGREGSDAEAASRVLRRINELYTVYHGIVLFDAECRVVAVSRADHEHWIGQTIEEPWARATLALHGTQAYSVSQFEPSAFYNNDPILIYGAGVRSAQGRILGGVAVLFDTKPQLAAMLHDSLPRDERGEPVPGCFAMFLDRDLRVMSATDSLSAAANLAIDALRKGVDQADGQVIRAGDNYYALGTGVDTGYREYAGIGAHAVVLIPLGAATQRQLQARPALPERSAARHEGNPQQMLEFATFAVGAGWFAVPTANVIEAVDARGVQPLPGRESWCAGFLMFDGEALMVADLSRLLNLTCIEAQNVVIVIRAEGRERPFGLLVEALGDIPEVPADRVLSIAGLRQQPGGLLVEHAIQPPDPNDALVMTLSIDRLVATLHEPAACTTPPAETNETERLRSVG